jgi:ubiquinone/menaquinone biosynthesis C-methylase UbiE/uncharacterized protein YbaR (Trm112 family)
MIPMWANKLVCPVTKLPLKPEDGLLRCTDGERCYPLTDGIPTFLTPAERGHWDSYNFTVDSAPRPALPYYDRFTEDWRTMVDLGSGDGTMSAGSAHRVADIYCVNPGITALRVLQKRGLTNMHPVNAFGENLPFPDNFFDGAFNIFVIEHIADPEPVLLEIRRVLKPGGQLVIATDTPIFYQYLRPLLEWRQIGWVKGWRKWKPNDPTHINMMSPKKLRTWLKRTGFEIVEEDLHYFSRKLCRWFNWLPTELYETLLTTMSVFVGKK